MAFNNTAPIFDYKALRLLMGIIAIAIAPLVSVIAAESLASVSASYHSNARDWFVGMLFVVGAFLWAYNGHSTRESIASKVASIAAICVALFPTACTGCSSDLASTIHGIAAIMLFLILAYFCFGPFRENTKGKPGKKGSRSKIYFGCGCVIVGSILTGLIAKLTISAATLDATSIIYWVEAIALSAFGVAWIVAGKVLRILADDDEALHLFRH